MKRFFVFSVVILVVACSVFSCKKDTDQSAKSSSGSKVLKMMLSEEPSSGDALVTALNKWAKETGNTVETIVIPYDDQLTKFPLMAKNNDLPDLIATTRLASLYSDEFVDLKDYFDMYKFESTAVQIIVQEYDTDKISCLPQQFTITNVYYNKDAFEKAGIEVPGPTTPWTFDDLERNAALLKEKGGVKYGMAMDASRARYDNLMYMNNGSLVEKDGDSFVVAVNSPENIQTLERFIKWNNTFMPKAIWAGGTTDNPADYFKNGNVGIYFSGTWNYNTFYTQIEDFDWGVMTSPVGPAEGSAIMGGSGLAVPENAENKDLAIAFLEWFYAPENFQAYLNDDKGLSSLVGVTYSPSDEQVTADYKVMQQEVPKVSSNFIIDESSMWRTYYDNEYRDALKQAVNGDISASDALNNFASLLSEKSGWALKY